MGAEMFGLSSRKRLEFDCRFISLIGRWVRIINSKNKNQIGIEGVLIFESQNVLFIEYSGRIVKILKEGVVLEFVLEGKTLNMDARLLFSTIINRIKKIK